MLKELFDEEGLEEAENLIDVLTQKNQTISDLEQGLTILDDDGDKEKIFSKLIFDEGTTFRLPSSTTSVPVAISRKFKPMHPASRNIKMLTVKTDAYSYVFWLCYKIAQKSKDQKIEISNKEWSLTAALVHNSERGIKQEVKVRVDLHELEKGK